MADLPSISLEARACTWRRPDFYNYLCISMIKIIQFGQFYRYVVSLYATYVPDIEIWIPIIMFSIRPFWTSWLGVTPRGTLGASLAAGPARDSKTFKNSKWLSMIRIIQSYNFLVRWCHFTQCASNYMNSDARLYRFLFDHFDIWQHWSSPSCLTEWRGHVTVTLEEL